MSNCDTTMAAAQPSSAGPTAPHSALASDDTSEVTNGRDVMEELPLADGVFHVEKILKKRVHPKQGVQYFVKWRDFPDSENTWEPAKSFLLPNLIRQFEEECQHKNKRQKTSHVKRVSAHNRQVVAKPRDINSNAPNNSSSRTKPSTAQTVANGCSAIERLSQISSTPQQITKINSNALPIKGQTKNTSQKKYSNNNSEEEKDILQDGDFDEPLENVNTVITVTDLTWRHQTVTICESDNPVGFFKDGKNISIDD